MAQGDGPSSGAELFIGSWHHTTSPTTTPPRLAPSLTARHPCLGSSTDPTPPARIPHEYGILHGAISADQWTLGQS